MLAALGFAALFCTMPAMAADEHGHDHDAPAAASGPALPRFTAVSEAFELVGVVSGKELTVYVDRFNDNAPVKDANVELEIAGEKVALKQGAEGEYTGTLAQELKPGVIAVTASIVAGSDSDILSGDLDLHEQQIAHETHTRGLLKYGAFAAAAVLVLGAVAWQRRRGAVARRARMGGAA